MPEFVFDTSDSASSSQTAPGQSAADTAVRDEALDPLTGDLLLAADGDQVFLAGVEGIASDVLSAWQQVKGEWFLDLTEGVDYYGLVFVKKPDLNAIKREFIRVALLCPGVKSVPKFDPVLDTTTRTLSASYEVECDTGEIFSDNGIVLSPGGA